MFWLSAWGSGGARSQGTGNGEPPTRDRATQNQDKLAVQLQQIEWLASMFFGAVILAILLYSLAEWWRLSQAVPVEAASGFFDSIFVFLKRCFLPLVKSLPVFIFNFGVLFALSITAAVVGGLLGFLFGIPRALQGNGVVAATAGPAGGNGSAGGDAAKAKVVTAQGGRAFAGNSNLEEISDWLTKIIVGVGLVQASTIYTKLFALAEWFKTAIVCNPPGGCAQGADVMFLLVLISSLIGGFLFLYLETRTRVIKLFTDVEAVLLPTGSDQALAAPAIESVLQAPIGTGRSQSTAPSSLEDKELIKIPYESLKTGDQLAAWGSAQARAGNLQAASEAVRAAIVLEPNNKEYLVRLADVYERQGMQAAATALINEAQQKEGDDLALVKRKLVEALYLGPPLSFETALPISRQLLSRPEAARDPFVQVWTAAAEGQRYRWLTENGGSDQDKTDARTRALAAVKEVVRLAPDPKSTARALLRGMLDTSQPGVAPEDDDLEVFKNDEEFRRTIGI